MSLNRDAHHFLTVIEANKGIIYKVANAYCHDAENRKDLIQEITIQLWLAFPKYDESYRITTWMYRIALNVSISFYRKENRRSGIAQPLHPEIIFLQENNDPFEQDQDITLLHKFIKELKEIDRAIIILYLEENSQQEIAEMLGITPTNVSTRVLRIKEQIRQKFSALKS
jgi:RNA polymerase sigma-70 factor (ECF subfamily)